MTAPKKKAAKATDLNYFERLNSLNVSEHVEKKGKHSYLSWAWAVEQLGRLHPGAMWEVHEYTDQMGNAMPYMKTECGFFVKVTVRVPVSPEDGHSPLVDKTQIHPVLDNSNKPVAKPNAFQINTSIMRCLVKAIALHGLGLYIYAGEDLPTDEPQAEPDASVIAKLDVAAKAGHDAFVVAWKATAEAQRKLIRPDVISAWKKVTEKADAK